jgi:hypothetical protein
MKRLVTPAFLVIICLLGLAELVARVFFPLDISGRFEYGYNLQAGFDEHANGVVELVRAGGRRFHPQKFMKHRPPGTFRVFVVGDSVPRGPGLRRAYPWLLGAELRQGGIQSEVINLAVPGYGPRRCQVVLRKALEFEPSLVILHINDTNKWEDEREWRRAQEFKSWHPQNWLMKVFIFRRLYEAKNEKLFWNLIPEEIRVKYAANDADAKVALAADPKEIAARIELAREKTAENVALLQRQGVPALLLTQCCLDQVPCLRLNDHGLDALVTPLLGAGVYHLSMKEVFARVQDCRPYFAGYNHLQPSGHRLLAQAIFGKIAQERTGLGLDSLRLAGADKAPGADSKRTRTQTQKKDFLDR